MATFLQANVEQSKPEIRTWVIDYTDDLLTGVTVSAGTAIHTPPSGTAGTPVCVVSSPYINATIGPLSAVGMHYLEVRATLSDGEISSVTISIPVGYATPTAREGMLDLIDTVRGMADVGPADFKIGAVSYWNDAQIQKALDRHRIDVYQEELEQWPVLGTAGAYEYYEYRASRGNLESGTAYLTCRTWRAALPLPIPLITLAALLPLPLTRRAAPICSVRAHMTSTRRRLTSGAARPPMPQVF